MDINSANPIVETNNIFKEINGIETISIREYNEIIGKQIFYKRNLNNGILQSFIRKNRNDRILQSETKSLILIEPVSVAQSAQVNRRFNLENDFFIKKIGTTGFEPATSTTPRQHATKLRHVPIFKGNTKLSFCVSTLPLSSKCSLNISRRQSATSRFFIQFSNVKKFVRFTNNTFLFT